MDSSAIARIEQGRVPLKYHQAREILRFFKLNPMWVATGMGLKQAYWELPNFEKSAENDDFSKVMEYFGERIFPQYSSDVIREAEQRSSEREPAIELITLAAREWCGMVNESSFNSFFSSLIDYGYFLAEKYQQNAIPDNALSNPTPPRPRPENEIKKKDLHDVNAKVNDGDVNQMASLINRLLVATQARGKKSELARFLGLPLASVSQWLSGKRSPSGETTLKLLEWVERRERETK